ALSGLYVWLGLLPPQPITHLALRLAGPDRSARQRVHLQIIARRRFEAGMAGRADGDILAPLMLIGHRAGLRSGRKPRLPEQSAGRGLEGAEVIVLGRANESEAACRDQRTAKVGRSGHYLEAGRDAKRADVEAGAEWLRPDDFAGVDIGGSDIAPRRRDAGYAERR